MTRIVEISEVVRFVGVKTVVVGGVAGGMSFAARARRLAEDAEIVVLERDDYVSFANCGLPYHLGGEIPDRDALLLHTPTSLAESLNLDVRTGHEVTAINPTARTVRVHQRDTGHEYDEPYDALVLSPGATPFRPPIPGTDLPQVRALRNIPDLDALHNLINTGATHATVVGAGFIGLEVTEALRRRGLNVTLIEQTDQVLPPLDREMARAIELELLINDVDVRTNHTLTAIHPTTNEPQRVTAHLSDTTTITTDLVILAIGVRPETTLARTAGLTLNNRGAITVNQHYLTSDPHIYAVGDAIEVTDAITNTPTHAPLAGPANRQGRAAADHLFNRPTTTNPVQSTAIVRVFDLTAATTGRNQKTLTTAAITHHTLHLHPTHHAGYYPGAMPIHLKLLFTPDTGHILGAQATGREGVDKRIDIIATAIRAGLTVHDLADLELAYAPPFSSAKDPINIAGMAATNILTGDLHLWHPTDLPPLPTNPNDPTTPLLLDVRSTHEYTRGHLPGALNIPHTQLRHHLHHLPTNRPILTYCATGHRSYLAQRLLHQTGHPNTRSLSGGITTLLLTNPTTPLQTGTPTTNLAPAQA